MAVGAFEHTNGRTGSINEAATPPSDGGKTPPTLPPSAACRSRGSSIAPDADDDCRIGDSARLAVLQRSKLWGDYDGGSTIECRPAAEGACLFRERISR
jgi:hypothetical protein